MLVMAAASPPFPILRDPLWAAESIHDGPAIREDLEHVQEGVYFVDLERRINYWNRSAERISGFLRHQVLGRFCMDGDLLVHCDEHGTILCKSGCPLAGTMVDRQCRQKILYLRHRQGHRLPVRVRAVPLVGPEGELVGAMEVFTTVRPAAHHRDSQARYGLLWFELDGLAELPRQVGRDAIRHLISSLARTLKDAINSESAACEWEQGQYVVVLGGDEAEHPDREAERLRHLLEESRIPWWGDHLGGAVRAGATHLEPSEEGLSALERAKLSARAPRPVIP